MNKSLILPWTKENIESAPETFGVLLLRSTPVNGDIVAIEETMNIKKDLMTKFEENLDEIRYFDWYSTEDINKAKEIKEELVGKYHLEDILSQ